MSTETNDPAEVLPGGMTRAAFLALREANPVIAARYANANGINVHVANDPRNGSVRAATIRGELPTAPSTTTSAPADEHRARYAEMQKTNPVAAARYALEHGIHDTKGA